MRSSTHLKQYPMASDLAPVRITSRPHGRLFFCLSNPGYRPEHGITPCALHIGTPKKETMNNLPSDDELDSIVAKTAPAPTTTTTPTPAQAEAISEWNADDEDGGSDVLRAVHFIGVVRVEVEINESRHVKPIFSRYRTPIVLVRHQVRVLRWCIVLGKGTSWSALERHRNNLQCNGTLLSQ